jgi:hypothetical protein
MQADMTKSEGVIQGLRGAIGEAYGGAMGGSGIGHYKKLKRCVFTFL